MTRERRFQRRLRISEKTRSFTGSEGRTRDTDYKDDMPYKINALLLKAYEG